MRFSSLAQLAPDDACRRLEVVDLEEKARLAEGLALIALVDARRDFLAAGYSSMHAYCTGRLRWSDDRTLKRLQVARLGARLPRVFEYMEDGRLTLTAACELAPVLTAANVTALLERAAFQPRHAVRRLVYELTHPATPPAPEGSASSHAPAHVDSHADSAAAFASIGAVSAADTGASSHAPAHGTPAKRGRVVPNLTGEFDVRLTLTADEHAALAEAQDLLAHVVRDGDPAIVVAKALAHYVAHLKKRRFGAGPASAAPKHTPRGGHVPLALRKHVAERDGHRCTFVGTEGHRCESTHALQFDHIVPLAEGGATSAENLRLLCPAHNRFEAERLLGKDRIAAMRERRERATALTAAARAREQQRTSDRECDRSAQEPTPTEVVIEALESLGYKRREAREAARASASDPAASIEVHLRQAIRHLSHAVIARSERWARATS